MGKIKDGVLAAFSRVSSTKSGKSKLRWPKRKPTAVEKRQLDRWEGEGGSVHEKD